jgi:hypothetical protein
MIYLYMKKSLNLVLLLLFCNFSAFAQNSNNDFIGYNIGLGSLVGGIGAVINKNPGDKWGKVLLKGMWQGALGGALVHQSKVLVGKIGTGNSFAYSWYGKFTNAAGNSIIENAAMNRNFYDQFNLNIGFNRIELHTRDQLKVKYKIMPVSVLIAGYLATKSKFEVEKTLQTGEVIFSSSRFKTDLDFNGFTVGNIVVMESSDVKSKSTYAHEFIHVYQYYDFNFVNSFINKPINKIGFINRTSKYLYYDLQTPVLQALYSLEYEGTRERYYDNFFEREAGIFSNTIPE